MDRIASEELEVGGKAVFTPQWKVLHMDAGKCTEVFTLERGKLT